MPMLDFLIHLAGAMMLLLFAVRMVRTGIERSFGAHFRELITGSRSRFGAAGIGAAMAIILQSSAAVALLSAGFASNGAMSFGTGLAIVLGADLGSALVVRLLSFPLDWLTPMLLALGGWLFLKSETRRWRQFGRIFMGLAFILIALHFLRSAMDPIRDSAFLPAIANYLAADFVSAFLVGATLAFVMHSSIAAILMCVTLVQIGALPFAAGLSLVLGANMGGALIPVWLARTMPPSSRRITWANAGLRGGWATALLLTLNLLPEAAALLQRGTAATLIYAHIAFNAALILLAVPGFAALDRLFTALIPEPAARAPDSLTQAPSALDPHNIAMPVLALASLKRELSRMSAIVEEMFTPLPQIYQSGSAVQIKTIRATDQRVNDCLSGIRDFVAALPDGAYSKAEKRAARDLVDYAIRLESAGDLIAKRFTTLAEDLRQSGAQFSAEGWTELTAQHASIVANMKLAGNVLISDDVASARLLKLEKDELKRADRQSRKRHLKRLKAGTANSVETSDIHLETLIAFREFNSHISSIAFPILYQNGQLLETRLINNLPEAEAAH